MTILEAEPLYYLHWHLKTYALSLGTHFYAQFLLQVKNLLFGESRYLRVLVIEVSVERWIINLARDRREAWHGVSQETVKLWTVHLQQSGQLGVVDQ